MENIFEECNELEYIDLYNFDTNNITNIGYMFNKCRKLKEIKGIKKFKTSNVIDIEGILFFVEFTEDENNYRICNTYYLIIP